MKIRGTIYYFGNPARRVDGVLKRAEGDGAKEAEEAYNAVREDLPADRTPRVNAGGLTVKELRNRFLTAKRRKVEAEVCRSRAEMRPVPRATHFSPSTNRSVRGAHEKHARIRNAGGLLSPRRPVRPSHLSWRGYPVTTSTPRGAEWQSARVELLLDRLRAELLAAQVFRCERVTPTVRIGRDEAEDGGSRQGFVRWTIYILSAEE